MKKIIFGVVAAAALVVGSAGTAHAYPVESSKYYDSGSYDELLAIPDEGGFQTNDGQLGS